MYVYIYCEQNATLHCILVIIITHRQHIHSTTIMLFANSNAHRIRHKKQIRTCDSNMKSNLQFYFLSSMLMPHATYAFVVTPESSIISNKSSKDRRTNVNVSSRLSSLNKKGQEKQIQE